MKKKAGVYSAFAALLIFYLLPATGELSHQALSAIGILIAALILWITEAMPISVSTLLMICVMGLEGVVPFPNAISNISTNTALFIMASSAITIAVSQSSLPERISSFLISRYRRKPARLVLYFGIAVAVSSAFMSSLATCALFACIVDSTFHDSGPHSMRKSLMLAVPACAGIGGFMTPAGTPANVLLLELFREHGKSVSFAQWSAVGFPIGLLAVIVFMISLIFFFRPAFSDESGSTSATATADAGISVHDIKTMIIVGTIIFFWFAGSWIPNCSITLIAMLGMAVMFLPHVELLNWDSFSKGVNWDLVITMGTVSVLMDGVSKTGAVAWFAEKMIAPIGALPALPLLIALSLSICFLRAFIPTTTAVVTLLSPMLISIAAATNQDLSCLLMTLAFWTASALLLVFTEPIYLITYSKGDYKAADLLKIGIIPCLFMAAANAFLIPALLKLIHIA